jgi:hypothetical protein
MFPHSSEVKCRQCTSPKPNPFAHDVKRSQAPVVNSYCDVACTLDREEDAHGNEDTLPIEQVSQVTQENEVTTAQLDLHGCTREDAIVKLNDSLMVWVDTAMAGRTHF